MTRRAGALAIRFPRPPARYEQQDQEQMRRTLEEAWTALSQQLNLASPGTLTFGTHLSGTSYDGGTDTALATDATSANTPSTLVARGASGEIAVGAIVATSVTSGPLTGTTFGVNGATPQAAAASGGALAAYGAGANGFDTAGHAQALYAMVVAIRAALVANGIMS